jgi:hypothetical protein
MPQEMLKESELLFQMAGVSENEILILKENTKSSVKVKEILLGFQKGFERMIR